MQAHLNTDFYRIVKLTTRTTFATMSIPIVNISFKLSYLRHLSEGLREGILKFNKFVSKCFQSIFCFINFRQSYRIYMSKLLQRSLI